MKYDEVLNGFSDRRLCVLRDVTRRIHRPLGDWRNFINKMGFGQVCAFVSMARLFYSYCSYLLDICLHLCFSLETLKFFVASFSTEITGDCKF